LNASGAVNLVGTTSNTSFTIAVTFGRKHHSFPYSILCDSSQGLHPNGIFFQDSQVGVSKLKLLLFWNFGCLYIFKSNLFGSCDTIFYNLQKDFSNNILHTPIGDHFTPTLKGFVIEGQIENLTLGLSFDHNSCISCVNE
jgi:hypothetical protein